MTGQPVSDEEIVSAHPELQPDLAAQLRVLAHVERARARARDAPSYSASGSPLPGATSTLDAGVLPGSIPGYEILRRIHQGGQGVVFEAIQKSTKRTVAIKVMREGLFADSGERARFDREAQVLAQLDHPNIVTIHDRGTASGLQYFVMDYVEGRRLDEHFRDNGSSGSTPNVPDVVRLFVRVAEAVHAAHVRGIIHRDLKPGNILIDDNGKPHILDFGLAKISPIGASELSNAATMTMTGQFVGSLPWASPEQANGNGHSIDLRSDVYSLGVTLFQILTGKFPYEVTGPAREVLNRVAAAEPASPRSIRRDLDEDIDTIVLKCLSKEKDRRYETAGALAQDLNRYLANEPIEARRDSHLYVLRKAVWKHRLATSFAATIAAVLIVSTVIAWNLYGKAAHAADLAAKANTRQALQLRASYLDQARALRGSGQVGQQLGALDALAKAAGIRPGVDLRNEAIASMSALDIQLERHLSSGSSYYKVCFDRELRQYAAVLSDGDISVRLVADDREVARLKRPGRSVCTLEFSPTGRMIAARSDVAPAELALWDLPSGRQIGSDKINVTHNHFRFTPDETRLIVIDSDRFLRVLSVDGLSEESAIHLEFAPNSLAIHPVRTVAAVSDGGRVYEADFSAESVKPLCHCPGNIFSMNWDRNGERLALACGDFNVYVWNADSPERFDVLRGHQGVANFTMFDPGGQWLASHAWDETTRIWNVANGTSVLSLSGQALEIDPGGTRIGVVCADEREFRSAVVLKLVRPLSTHLFQSSAGLWGPFAGHISPDQRLLSTDGGDGVLIWDIPSGARLANLPIGSTHSAIFVPDGRSFLTSGERGLLRWPLVTGNGALHIGPPETLYAKALFGCRISGDGRKALAANHDAQCAMVFDLLEPAHSRTLGPHASARLNIDISHDGRWAATGTWKGNDVKVWDTESGELLVTLTAPGGHLVSFSPDSRWLLAYNHWGHRVWDCRNWHLASEAKYEKSIDEVLRRPSYSVRLLDPVSLEEVAHLPLSDAWKQTQFLTADSLIAIPLNTGDAVCVFDIRRIREKLREMDLDWNPSEPLPPAVAAPPFSHVSVDLGVLAE